MKKMLEPLEAEKFKPMPQHGQAQVRGGTATPGGSTIVGTVFKNRKVLANGEIYYEYQFIYKTWTSDDTTGDTTCLYGVGSAESDWRHN